MRWQAASGIAAACLFTGIAVGCFWAGRSGRQSSRSADASSAARHSRRRTGPADLRNRMDDLNQALHTLVGQGDPGVIADELRMSAADVHGHVLLGLVMQYWADETPDGAVAYAMNMEDSEGRLDFLAVALGSMAKSDLITALQWVDLVESSYEREFLLASVYSGYAKTDPEGAMSAAEQMTPGYGRDLALSRIAEVWAQDDITAVFGWLETQPVNRRTQNLYGQLMVTYMQQAPEEAGLLIEDMAPGSQKTSLACQYSRLLAAGDIQTALAWAEQLPDAAARQEALAVAVDAWLEDDHEGSFNYALQADVELGSRLMKQVAVQMADDDPAAAAESLNRFPVYVQPDAAREMARIWATRDPEGVANWIDTLSDSQVHQQAITGAVYPLVNQSPEIAYQLAASLSDSSRYDLMRYTAKVWYEADPYAVYDAINADTVLSQQDKEQLLAQVSNESTPMDLVLPAAE